MTTMREYWVWFELFGRDGYKLSNAHNTFRAETAEDAARQAIASAESRGMSAEITLIQEWPR